MGKHTYVVKAAAAHKGTGASASQPRISEAQLRRIRQQTGVAKAHATEAEKRYPALGPGVSMPERLAEQAKYVLNEAMLQTERHHKGKISNEHVGHIISSVVLFAQALDRLGIKVLGLLRLRQNHYLQVMALWQKQPPGDFRKVQGICSNVRRLLVVIGLTDVIPRGAANKKLLNENKIIWGTEGAFLINTYLDWASPGLDAEIVFEAIPDRGKRVAAGMMYYWGLSLLEVASWRPVDPEGCKFLQLEGIEGRYCRREVEFSSDPGFAAMQLNALTEAWNFCLEQHWPTICPPDLSPQQYAERLGGTIGHVLVKKFPDKKITPMQLCDGFFCRVFRDYAGVFLHQAGINPRLALEDRSIARAWNEAKRQCGVRGTRAPHAEKGMPYSWSQSLSVARDLRFSISPEFANLCIGNAWVGDVDVSAGKCLFVQLQRGAQASTVLRLQELIEQKVVVKLRVIPVLSEDDVPEGAAPVMTRSVPV